MTADFHNLVAKTNEKQKMKWNKQRRQQIKDYEVATPEVTQPSKNNLFLEKTTQRRKFCFLALKKKTTAKLIQKNAHCLGQEEQFLILYCIIKQLYLLL